MDELRDEGGFDLSQGALSRLQEVFASGRASEEETLASIARTLETATELLCPHSAVGVKVGEEHLADGVPMITLATAHPAKFPDAVEQATGQRPALPPRMADIFERPERVTRLANDLEAIKAHIRGNIRA